MTRVCQTFWILVRMVILTGVALAPKLDTRRDSRGWKIFYVGISTSSNFRAALKGLPNKLVNVSIGSTACPGLFVHNVCHSPKLYACFWRTQATPVRDSLHRPVS